MHQDGEVVGTGAGGAVLGSPINALVWLANTVGPLGITLDAGSVIMPGSLTAAVAVIPGPGRSRHLRRNRLRHRIFRPPGDRMTIAAIVGPGNIGTDLLVKLQRTTGIEVRYMVGVDPASDGLARARSLGVEASAGGVDWLLAQDDRPDLVFEATSAAAHLANAPRYAEAGITAIDLTPAAVGPFVCPAVNLDAHLDAPNINMITCGGQATIPIVHAVSRVDPGAVRRDRRVDRVPSAGPGTRANIDEFTETTARAIESVGGAARGKAIIILNPVDPPMIMRDTVFCAISAGRRPATRSPSRSTRWSRDVQQYVPGYTLRADPQFDDPRPEWHGNGRVAVFLEVSGNGDYLPPCAGNLDIMTAAAVRVGELIARRRAVDSDEQAASSEHTVRLTDTTLRDGSHADGAPVHRGSTCATSSRALDRGRRRRSSRSPTATAWAGRPSTTASPHTDELKLIEAAVDEADRAKIAVLLLPGLGTVEDLRARTTPARRWPGSPPTAPRPTSRSSTSRAARDLGMETVGFLMLSHRTTPDEPGPAGADHGRRAAPVRLRRRLGRRPACPTARRPGRGAGRPSSGTTPRSASTATRTCRSASPTRCSPTQTGARQIDGTLCALGAGAGNSPTEILAATFDRLGVADRASTSDGGAGRGAEDVVRPFIPRLPVPTALDRPGLLRASTLSSCCTPNVPPSATACPRTRSCAAVGEAGYVGGQEDMIIDVALTIAAERSRAVPAAIG